MASREQHGCWTSPQAAHEEPLSLNHAEHVQRLPSRWSEFSAHLHRNQEKEPRGPGQYHSFQSITPRAAKDKSPRVEYATTRRREGGEGLSPPRSTVIAGGEAFAIFTFTRVARLSSRRVSAGSAAIKACDQLVGSPGRAAMLAALKEAFVDKRATAKEISQEVLAAIDRVATEAELDVAVAVLGGYKSNSPAVQKRRILQLCAGDIAHGELSVPEAALPVRMQLAVDAKRRRLGGVGVAPASESVPAVAASSSASDRGGVASDTEAAGDARALEMFAEAFKVSKQDVVKIRRGDAGRLFSMIDRSANYAGLEIRRIFERNEEVHSKCVNRSVGNRPTPMGDIRTVVEVIMLLPGRRAGLIRADAARLFVSFYGGDLAMVDEVMQRRDQQDALREEMPAHPARAFGEDVELRSGSSDDQRTALQRRLEEGEERSRKMTSYDPSRMAAMHHAHKDAMNDYFIEGLLQAHEPLKATDLPGCIAILDDLNATGQPRTTTALVEAGVPVGRVLAPNREDAVVLRLTEMGALSVKKEFRRALDEDYADKQIVGAYVDSTSGDPHALQGMIDAVCSKSRRGKLAVAYTLVERNFVQGGAREFTKRVLEMSDYMRGKGFVAQMGEPHRSYFEPTRPCGKRVGTQFWVRMS